MGFFNWFKNNSASGVTHKRQINTNVYTKNVNELEKLAVFLKNYVKNLLNVEPGIEKEIEQLASKTKQNLKKENLMKELWILRYMFLHVWFFEIKSPKNQNEVNDNLFLLKWAFKSVLNDNNKSNYLPWLETGFVEYTGTNELNFSYLEEFKSNILEKISEKIPLIAFESTEGRLGGELYDGVIELIMTIVAQDKNNFEIGDSCVTTEQVGNIKKVIEDLKSSHKKAGKEFFEDLLHNDRESLF